MTTSTETGRSSDESNPLVSVVIVTYNSHATLAACLDSIPSAVEVIVVDQSPDDHSYIVAQLTRPDAKLISAGKNRGFGAGCNLGAANANGRVLIFLNPDAYFHPGSMQLLADAALKYNALVGPTIVNPAGEDETRARNHSTMIMDITDELLPRRFMRGALERNISMNNRIYRVGGPVPYIQGSCMALAADAFRSVGGFDERFFLYYEEESLARSLARVGVEVRLEPQAQITHIGGVSTSQTPYFSIGQLYRSKALFYSIHFSRIRSSLFASTLWSLFKIMSMATSVRRIANIREDRDREWYRSAAQGVMSGRKSRMVDPPDLALRRERYSKGRSSSPGKTLVKPSERK